ncbi:hypothetical protein HDZ31DRAFT_76574 [Schizophyllum fasciatum]
MSEDDKLPQELKELILGYLYADHDTESLSACAIAHRSLYRTSQAYLFRDVSIHGSMAAACLYRSLLGCPRLCAHVHVLRLEEFSRSNQWIYRSEEALPGILDLLYDLQELYVHPSSVYYGALGQETREALLKALARPSLRVLSLACIISLPVSIFCHTSQLRDLRLSWLMIQELDMVGAPHASPIDLSDLTLCLNLTTFGAFMLTLEEDIIFRVDRLRSLRLDVQEDGWQAGAAVLVSRCANTLQCLEIGCSAVDSARDFTAALTRISLPHLKALALRDVPVAQYAAQDRDWVWLSHALTAAPGITHLIIDFDARMRPLFYLSGTLKRLGDLLTGGTDLRLLRKVVFTVSRSRASDDSDSKELQALKRGVLAALMEKVEVSIDPVIPYGDVQPPLFSLADLDE